jgi:hypothetical protein
MMIESERKMGRRKEKKEEEGSVTTLSLSR